MSDTSGASFCPRCGGPAGVCGEACRSQHRLDPDRYCATCGRRLRVQVLPHGISADCKVCRMRREGRLPGGAPVA